MLLAALHGLYSNHTYPKVLLFLGWGNSSFILANYNSSQQAALTLILLGPLFGNVLESFFFASGSFDNCEDIGPPQKERICWTFAAFFFVKTQL